MTKSLNAALSLLMYASQDAAIKGLPMPKVSGLSTADTITCLARFMSDCEMFLPDDPNLDNQKRNLAIRMFIDYPIDEIREYSKRWIDKFRQQEANSPWFKEWEIILATFTDEDLIKIYLSSDQESTRRRISRPTGLLPFDVSLEVKQKGYPI
jgi:hypothetical protein